MNIVAKKSRRESKKIIESIEIFDKNNQEFSYLQRVIRYFESTGGESEEGDWYEIKETDFDAEEGTEITYDNHPSK